MLSHFSRIFLIGFFVGFQLFVTRIVACSVPQFDASVQTSPRSIPLLLQGNHDLEALRRLAAITSPTPIDDLFRSRAQLALGQLDAAMLSAEKALASNSQNSAFHVQVAAVAGRMAEHAGMFKQLSLAKRARRELEEALAIDPKSEDALYGLMLYFDLAPSFMGGDKAKAQKLAEQLTALTAARGYLAQASLAKNRKDVTSEEALLGKAVDADPLSYEVHIAMAIFEQKGDSQQAERADEQACTALYIDPSRVEAWQLLAEMAADADCPAELDGLLTLAHKFVPDDMSPAYRAAVALLGSGKHLDLVKTLLNRYLQVPQEGNSPSAGLAHYQLALLSEKEGHDELAVQDLRAAIDEDPTLEEARKHLKRLEHPSHTQ